MSQVNNGLKGQNLNSFFQFVGTKPANISPSLLSQVNKFNFKFCRAEKGDKGVVVLLGWLGCKDRYLQKYSEALSELGWHSLRAILDLFQEAGVQDRKIVLMAFSNNGAVLIEKYNKLLLDKKYEKVSKNMVGIVYDSAPAYMHLEKGAEAIRKATPSFILGWMISICFYIAAFFISWRPAQFWKNINEPLPNMPYLFLYCKNDELVDVNKLEEVVSNFSKQNRVVVKGWDESKHCAHLVYHKEEYTNSLNNFLDSL
eukprot:TRINITY_DN8014_c0_g1_i3.p1 TRINITY_DN8014_c0_g1~~TRINITY_DN8014_c0_g1_i3.p1  ORF type:complete len:257 (-),score=30.81 TRINITY_DN8014_c0_g1_i3:268-1038(-)